MKDIYMNFPGATTTDLADLVNNSANLSEPELAMDVEILAETIAKEIQAQIGSQTNSAKAVATRIAKEVERICLSSPRIQKSGCVKGWQLALARHRASKCVKYYQLGVKHARVELHSTLGSMVYRHIAPARASQMGFQGRYQILEDFLQNFYIECLSAFRRENETVANYTPRTQLEVSEYLSFTEQYARRRINLRNGGSQQLLVLRAQSFVRRQPAETAMDIELAAQSSKSDEVQAHGNSSAMQQVRASMVSDATDPTEAVLRDRVVEALVKYFTEQGQSDCVDYLILKLQDLSAKEIDEILGLSTRQRDYLQQRFKYHVEKFSRQQEWQLVHQWLGADLDQKLGMNTQQWEMFWQQLEPSLQQLWQLKRNQKSDSAIASLLKWTPKQVQKRWSLLLEKAWQVRNSSTASQTA
jgi:hypothetical protein